MASAEQGRHASNLELFLDLVFVFSVTQITTAFSHDPTVAGLLRGLLVAWMVWWLWSQFTWLGTAVDLGEQGDTMVMVLVAVPLVLMMAVAIPRAYEHDAYLLAVPYCMAQLWALAIQGRSLWRHTQNRSAWLLYAPIAAVAPALFVVGSFVATPSRTVLWCVAGSINVAAGIRGSASRGDGVSEWAIDPVHFAERHSLFVIIVLGEALVAIGATASSGPLTRPATIAVAASALMTCALWWTYFAYIPKATEQALAARPTAGRGQLARDLFTFGHFPIVAGVMLFAVAAKYIVANPGEHLDGFHLTTLVGGLSVFLGALAISRWVAARRPSNERLMAIATIVLVGVVAGRQLNSSVVVVLLTLIVGAMQSYTVRRLTRPTSAQ